MADKTKVIETERLLLRKFEESDIENVFNNYSSRDKVTEFLSWKVHKTIDDTKAFVSDFVIPLYKEDDLPEKPCISKEAREKLANLFPSGFIWDNIRPVSEYCSNMDKEICECNCFIKGVVADGIGYVTSGRIYILNDNGQTIQKI